MGRRWPPRAHDSLGLPVVGPVPFYRFPPARQHGGRNRAHPPLGQPRRGRLPPESRRFAPGQRARALRAAATLLCLSAAGCALNALRVQGRSLQVVLGYAAVGTMVGAVLALAAIAAAHARSRDRS